MAAKKPPAKAPAKSKAAPTRRERATAQATKLGYGGDVAAMKAVSRQYGLVNGGSGYKRMSAAEFQRNMDANGWTESQPVANPVNIGGMRVMVGAGKAVFTGMRSDSAKRGPGGSYLDPSGEYSAAGYKASGAKGKKGGKGKGKGGGKGGGKGNGPAGTSAVVPEAFGGPDPEAYTPYAEADTSTTSYLAAQGKAYGKGKGEGLMGQTSSPPEGESAVVEDAASGGGGRSGRGKHPGKKVTRKAKSKSSAGGKTVTAKERKKIQATKARARK